MDVDFIGTTDIVAGYNKNLNKYNGVFIATVFCKERPKYSFGRKWKTHLKSTVAKLPTKMNSDGTYYIDTTHKYSEKDMYQIGNIWRITLNLSVINPLPLVINLRTNLFLI
jgi:hypothetical protein